MRIFEALAPSSVDVDTCFQRNSRNDTPARKIDHITGKNNVILWVRRRSAVWSVFWSMFVGLPCHHHHHPTFLPSNHSGVQVRSRRASTSLVYVVKERRLCLVLALLFYLVDNWKNWRTNRLFVRYCYWGLYLKKLIKEVNDYLIMTLYYSENKFIYQTYGFNDVVVYYAMKYHAYKHRKQS